jgi:hypothetical protein
MSALPASAQCRTILADGAVATVTATRRARGGRADVKCALAAAPELAQRMQQVVRLARLTEARYDSRDQVVLSIDRVPSVRERDWELAAVLADRMVRGLFQPHAAVCANGWSDEWQLGRVAGCMLRGGPADLLRGGVGGVAHLGSLTGQPDQSPSVSSARAWFPIVSGGAGDSLGWVEVSVYPFAHDGADEETTIAVPELDLAQAQAVRQALVGARHFDGRALGRWRSAVRFGQQMFQGNSYELALVLADRLARGREFLPNGRVIASGCSAAWHAGRVDTVAGLEPKCALILRETAAGDRVLLPRAWQPELPAGFIDGLRARGASLACVERIGMI